MRIMAWGLLLGGCCEFPLFQPETCDQPTDRSGTDTSSTGGTGQTSDTGTATVVPPATGLNLSAPTGDDDYDRYTAALWNLSFALQPGDGTAQLMEGIAGITDLGANMPRGLVFAEEGDSGVPNVERFIEHWFFNAQAGWQPNRDLLLTGLNGVGWNSASSHLADWEVEPHTAAVYLCQDSVLTAVPSPADLSDLDYIDTKHIPIRYEFELYQDGAWVGSLLREQHLHDKLGEVWVDFWTYQEEFTLLGNLGADNLTLELQSRQGQTPPNWILNTPPAHRFSRIIYQARPGTQFTPTDVADPKAPPPSCDNVYVY